VQRRLERIEAIAAVKQPKQLEPERSERLEQPPRRRLASERRRAQRNELPETSRRYFPILMHTALAFGRC